jgi:hypothetical protein
MAYLKPPWFTVKVFNRIAMATGISNTATLTVTKRAARSSSKFPSSPGASMALGIWYPLAANRSG